MNIHDLMAAQIVRDAFEAKKVPEAAAGLVVRATAAAGIRQPVAAEPEPVQAQPQQTASPADELARQAAARMSSQYDGIITSLLKERVVAGEIDTSDPHALDAAGALKGYRYPDGCSEWELNGKTLIKFWPPDVAFGEGFMHVHQRYVVAI